MSTYYAKYYDSYKIHAKKECIDFGLPRCLWLDGKTGRKLGFRLVELGRVEEPQMGEKSASEDPEDGSPGASSTTFQGIRNDWFIWSFSVDRSCIWSPFPNEFLLAKVWTSFSCDGDCGFLLRIFPKQPHRIVMIRRLSKIVKRESTLLFPNQELYSVIWRKLINCHLFYLSFNIESI